jgi:predicted dehydrogenase
MKCLLIGYGNIGKIHAKYLSQEGLDWEWSDPNIKGGVENPKYEDYGAIFILTPEHTHFEVYEKIKTTGYCGKVFVEKPAVIDAKHLHIFNDSSIFTGLVERYNPAIVTLNKYCEPSKILNIDFSRCCVADQSSRVSLLEDIGIHDLDLYLYLTEIDLNNIKDIVVNTKNNTCVATITNGIIGRFIWSKDTFYKERKVVVRQDNCTFEADLQEQTVIKHYYHEGKIVSESLFVEKSSPIYNEHMEFFHSLKIQKSKQSHELLFRLITLEKEQ